MFEVVLGLCKNEWWSQKLFSAVIWLWLEIIELYHQKKIAAENAETHIINEGFPLFVKVSSRVEF